MDSRTIAIGDIHGHSLALRRILEIIQPRESDTIVTLGDVIDWGPDSRGVLEQLIELGEHCRLIPLLGNHEEMWLAARESRSEFVYWTKFGGLNTLDSYGPRSTWSDIPWSHLRFIEACPPSFETERFLFVHANYAWNLALDEQSSSLLRWTSIKDKQPLPHVSGKTVILGHTPGDLRDHGHYRCIDTGCGFGGLLTAMDVETARYWQVTEDGQLRDGSSAPVTPE